MSVHRNLVLVTGSSGLLGSALIRSLDSGFDVVGLDRAGPPHPPERADCIEVDLASEPGVANALKRVRRRHGSRIDSVVHLAAYYDFSGAPSPLYDSINVDGTERLLRNLRAFEVGQFVFSSTHLVHAPGRPGRPIDESWPLEPRWSYPRSKVLVEEAIRAGRGSAPAVLLRIAGVYDDRGHSIPLAHQIQRIYENRLTGHVYPGDRTRGQPFVHLDDTIRAIRAAIDRRDELSGERLYLIGEGETLSYEALQQTLGLLLHGRRWRTRAIPKAIAKAGAWVQGRLGHSFIKPWMIDLADDHYELDTSRARRELGWWPRHSLRGTLPKMAAALLADPVAWYREHGLALPRRLRKAAG